MKLLFLLPVLISMMSSTSSAVITEKVEYEYDGVKLVGYVAYIPGTEPRPGILVVHEWWGLNDYAKMRAEQLAELGYVAFTVDMYGDGAVATTPDEAGKMAGAVRSDTDLLRGRINAGLDVLKARADVYPYSIAAIGYCFGGTVALELARSGADIAGVVSFHGNLSTNAPAEAGDIKAKLLILTGADDTSVPIEQVKAFEDEMNNAGADWQIVLYSGAVHAFTNPAAGDDPSKGVAYNSTADKRSWYAMLTFFDEIFAGY